jgi:hypothetical protein
MTATDYAVLIKVMQPVPDEYRLEEPTLRQMLTPQISSPRPSKRGALGWQIWHLEQATWCAWRR